MTPGGDVSGQLIRATRPHKFRSGQWARLTGMMDDPENGRRCYAVVFPDGATDWWPVEDEAAGYQFLNAAQVAKAMGELGGVVARGLRPVLDWAAKMTHDFHRALCPHEHRRCLTCHPGRRPKPLAVNGHEYQRRLAARRKRRRKHGR